MTVGILRASKKFGEQYEDGLSEDNWIEENKYWLKKLPVEQSQYKDIFKAFNEKDWRHGSCGGCI